MNRFLLLIILFSISFINLCAQRKGQKVNTNISEDVYSELLRRYEDSLRVYRDSLYDGIAHVKAEEINKDLLLSYMDFQLFSPFTYYHSLIRERLDMTSEKRVMDVFWIDNPLLAESFLRLYVNRPELVRTSDSRLLGSMTVADTKPVTIKNTSITKRMHSSPELQTNLPVDVVVVKPNFWTYRGDYYLQFLQNYISGNWYKGGESNYSMVGAVTMQANYNNKQKLKLDNKLELKLGFLTSKSDSLHALKTSEDLIRYTGKIGLQATKKWYYTMQLVASTQFMSGYKSNNATRYSGFLAPLNVNLSLGMDYTVRAFKGKLLGNIHLAPVAYNFKYVKYLELSTRYGLDAGKHTLNDLGSECTVDLVWKFSDNVSWQTRLYGYTTYNRAEVEWENTFTFAFNRFISSKFFIYPRFDDGVARDGKHGFLQLKEYASLGFAYSF